LKRTMSSWLRGISVSIIYPYRIADGIGIVAKLTYIVYQPPKAASIQCMFIEFKNRSIIYRYFHFASNIFNGIANFY
jgi:hypothetical protein